MLPSTCVLRVRLAGALPRSLPQSEVPFPSDSTGGQSPSETPHSLSRSDEWRGLVRNEPGPSLSPRRTHPRPFCSWARGDDSARPRTSSGGTWEPSRPLPNSLRPGGWKGRIGEHYSLGPCRDSWQGLRGGYLYLYQSLSPHSEPVGTSGRRMGLRLGRGSSQRMSPWTRAQSPPDSSPHPSQSEWSGGDGGVVVDRVSACSAPWPPSQPREPAGERSGVGPTHSASDLPPSSTLPPSDSGPWARSGDGSVVPPSPGALWTRWVWFGGVPQFGTWARDLWAAQCRIVGGWSRERLAPPPTPRHPHPLSQPQTTNKYRCIITIT